ncbi:hypothetical protein HDU96_009563 [Phlyctochytrium bullatum]|nr:hypothetical protein HDU96_009563 [Phlyctochytrium bullatum]
MPLCILGYKRKKTLSKSYVISLESKIMQINSSQNGNITDKLASVSKKIVDATNQYGLHYEKSRLYLKEIKANEDNLSALHRKQKDLRSKLDTAYKKKNKDVEAIRKELGELDQEVLAREAFHEGFKRERFKAAMNARWDGLMEYAAKIPQGYPTPGAEVPPFTGAPTTAQIAMDFEKCFANWIASVPWPFTPHRGSDKNFLELAINGRIWACTTIATCNPGTVFYVVPGDRATEARSAPEKTTEPPSSTIYSHNTACEPPIDRCVVTAGIDSIMANMFG